MEYHAGLKYRWSYCLQLYKYDGPQINVGFHHFYSQQQFF